MRFSAILPFAFFPFAAAAQTKPAASTELAFNIGHAFDNASLNGHNESRITGGYLRGALSLLHGRNRFQYGATIEGGTNSVDDWYLAPGFVANYRIPQKTGYWYGGAMAGYTMSGDLSAYSPATRNGLAHGYVFGLQAGFVKTLGKRLALNAELAVRSSQTWHRYWEPVFQNSGPRPIPDDVVKRYEVRSIVYLPVTIGLRYRLKR